MNQNEIFLEGKASFKMGSKASDCPYTFDRSAFWMKKDYNGFNAVRWKLDSWMKGWIEAQKESK